MYPRVRKKQAVCEHRCSQILGGVVLSFPNVDPSSPTPSWNFHVCRHVWTAPGGYGALLSVFFCVWTTRCMYLSVQAPATFAQVGRFHGGACRHVCLYPEACLGALERLFFVCGQHAVCSVQAPAPYGWCVRVFTAQVRRDARDVMRHL